MMLVTATKVPEMFWKAEIKKFTVNSKHNITAIMSVILINKYIKNKNLQHNAS